MSPSAEVRVSDHLREIPAAVRPTVQAARRMVRAVAPGATEIAYRSRHPRSAQSMWKIVRYVTDGAHVVAIGTFPKHVTLFFFRGRELDDGSKLLEGAGKDLRYITLRAPADAQRPTVKRMVREAFKLGGTAASPAR